MRMDALPAVDASVRNKGNCKEELENKEKKVERIDGSQKAGWERTLEDQKLI